MLLKKSVKKLQALYNVLALMKNRHIFTVSVTQKYKPCIRNSLRHDVFATRIAPTFIHIRATKNKTTWAAHTFSNTKSFDTFIFQIQKQKQGGRLV